MKYFFLLISSSLFLINPAAFAQVGNCVEAETEAILDIGNVRARIYNNGALFWNGGREYLYEVPKGDSVQAIFAGNFVVAGLIDNQLRAATTEYGPYEFWPGPLDTQGNPPADCSEFDRIWEINSTDFTLLDQDGFISENMKDWPWELGAPVIDGDGDPDNYNLEGGDRPELLGNQTLWWIMNDRGNEHVRSLTAPIGLEVHGTAYAFQDAGAGGNITFYRYKLFNKNTSPFTKAFVGIWLDVDLGNFSDDYVGSDSLLHLGYVYNAYATDEGGYEEKPPALGFTFLITPKAEVDALDNDHDGEIDEPDEPTGLHAMVHYNSGGSIVGEPFGGEGVYNYLTARWQNGERITEGGNGYGFSRKPTRFMYSGDPITRSFWSEMKVFPDQESANPPADRRFYLSSGPFTLQPAESTELLGALVWARGNNHLDSVRKLKGITAAMQDSTESFLVSGYSPTPPAPLPPDPQFVLGFDQNFPNPFTSITTLSYSLPKTMQVRLVVYDILGREVKLLAEGSQQAGVYSIDFDGSTLPAGTYYARIELDHLRFTKLMVRVP